MFTNACTMGDAIYQSCVSSIFLQVSFSITIVGIPVCDQALYTTLNLVFGRPACIYLFSTFVN